MIKPGLKAALLGCAAACLLLGGAAAAPAAPAAGALRIFAIDVEGGAATLYVTPEGHSLLIDTGWPAGMGGPRAGGGGRGGAAGAAPAAPAPPPPPPAPSSAERIAAQLKALGLTKLDYLMLSHYHVDHSGGVTDLTKLIPVGTFVDHGPNRELPANPTAPAGATSTVTLYAAYLAAIGDKPHKVMAAGDTLTIDGLTLTAVTSDSQPIAKALPAGGKPGVGCDKAVNEASNGGEENPRSLGVLATYGQARILALGDSTWSTENKLVCPTDLIGKVDLMWLDNHGSANANSAALLATVKPTVLVSNNGSSKGAEAGTYDVLTAGPSLANLWQIHYKTANGDAKNAPVAQIANIDGGPDAMNPIQISVATSGAVTMTNPQTGFSKTYPKAP